MRSHHTESPTLNVIYMCSQRLICGDLQSLAKVEIKIIFLYIINVIIIIIQNVTANSITNECSDNN